MEADLQHCKVAVVGNVDSGKSTLVGVLTKAQPDDGNGSARKLVFNYDHEKESGRTSSVCYEIMGFDEGNKQILPDRLDLNRNRYWDEVVKRSSKIVTFIDLCGHLKYLRTTITGMCGLAPDYAMIIIGSNMGMADITNAHLGLCLIMKIPLFVVLTKIDTAPKNVFDETVEKIREVMRSPAVNRIPIFIKKGTAQQEIAKQAELMASNKSCPIFCVSSVKMEGIEELVQFISRLRDRTAVNRHLGTATEPFQFNIMETFMVKGIGIVVSGLVKAGKIRLEQQCYLGPDSHRGYKLVTIKSIHAQRKLIDSARAGELVCFNIKPVKDKLNRNDIRRGSMLLDAATKPEPILEFEAQIQVLKHHTTMVIGYQAVMHIGLVEQTARLVNIISKEEKLLRSGDKALVRFRFVYFSEHIRERDTFILRQGTIKALGIITRTYRQDQLQQQQKLMTAIQDQSKEVDKPPQPKPKPPS